MKLLVDVKDNQAADFIEMLKSLSHIKAQPISAPDAALLAEIKEIKKAFKNVTKIKAGKLKGRSAQELLNEL
ncbi:hypothetical protein [Mucilaginibacter arboris]|uniref:Uncharacterized protein n=1 Tax=Mucilaginibacter arboris TaxID=2682090 RepID=A0A7K1SSX8_9SPHI|nr:hypothetical protein [Mucilaginibacter arboris]MVN20357.1 hypothetical protein [Mucilaginibacter arboris]